MGWLKRERGLMEISRYEMQLPRDQYAQWVEHMGELGLLARSISKILRRRKELKCSPFFSDT